MFNFELKFLPKAKWLNALGFQFEPNDWKYPRASDMER